MMRSYYVDSMKAVNRSVEFEFSQRHLVISIKTCFVGEAGQIGSCIDVCMPLLQLCRKKKNAEMWISM